METISNTIPLIALLCSVIAILYAFYLAYFVIKQPRGNDRMIEISNAIKEGAMAYLNRQYKTVAIAAAIIFILIAVTPSLGILTGICFLVGAIFSTLAGYTGMNVSVRANVRTAQAASKGLKEALDISFKGGSVTGLIVVSLGLFGIAALYYIFHNLMGISITDTLKPIIGFGFGGSLISLFARVGGGIFTKAADVGADLVGKLEAGIPEDDPRNPAVIADNVGDNVGDCAGMGADLFETYAVTIIAAMLLANVFFPGQVLYVLYPMALGAAALLGTIFATLFVKLGKSNWIMGALYKGTFYAALYSAVMFYFITVWFFPANPGGLFLASLVGLLVMVLITMITEYYTSTSFNPVKKVAQASQTGAATNIIAGLAVGMQSTFAPVIVICIGIFVSFSIAGNDFNMGIYNIAIAASAMLSTCGIVVAIDSFGPITDNAGGIAEMAKLPESYRQITDELDAVGNTTKAVTKGYAIGSAGLAALALFVTYTQEMNIALKHNITYELNDPYILIGLFIGGALPFLFSSIFLDAVGRAAYDVVNEVRRQFREIKGLLEGTAKAEYAKCVDIVTKAAIKEMFLPGFLAIVTPLVVGLLLGPKALGGLLVGSIITGLLLALFQTNGGATWDNAKKYIELGNFGGKGSPAHAAAVVGDTVGDPCKDTAGPALNPMIKILNVVALLAVAMIASVHPF